MPHTSFDLETLSLAAAFILAAYLTHLCWSPPNPTPTEITEPLPKDEVGPKPGHIQARRFVTLSFWILHILLTVQPGQSTMLCPNRSNLSKSLFKWSPYTAAVLVAIIIPAPIRLLAFRELKENFTFRLFKPKTLVTTGLYAYAQHPSYPTNWLILVANIALLLRLDGVIGCGLPSWLVRWGMGTRGIGVWPVIQMIFAIMGLISIWIRVRDEEAMLKNEFGSVWEAYHRRTKRFVPGVF